MICSRLIAAGFALVAPACMALGIANADLGEANQFALVSGEIVLTNDSKVPVKILSVVPSRPGDKVLSAPGVLEAGQSSAVQLQVASSNDIGYAVHSFVVTTNEAHNNSYAAHARLFTLSLLDEPRPKVDFGAVRLGDKPETKHVVVSSAEASDLRITKILHAPGFIAAQIADDRRSVDLRVAPGKLWGDRKDDLKLELSSKEQPQVWVEVEANIIGDVATSADPYNLGVVRTGEPHDFLIPLSSLSKQPFSTGEIAVEGMQATTKVEPCASKEPGCKVIHLHLGADLPAGFLRGVLQVPLPDFKTTLPIHVGGLVVGADARIEPLEKKIQSDRAAAAQRSSTGPGPNLANAIKQAVDPATSEAVPAGDGPLLKWTVGNGQPLYGFIVFRGEHEDGPFRRVTPHVIRSTATDNEAVKYQYRDNTAESGKAYWYYIGVVYNDGHKQQLSGPQKFVAK
jgi:hypothetical protein